MEAITSNLGAVINYPDPEAKMLRRAVSERTGLPEEMIVAGNGAVEIIYLLVKEISPAKALIPAPTFNEYEIAVRIHNGSVRDLPLSEETGFSLDINDVFRCWQDSSLLFLCNPNNPTGSLISAGDVREIVHRGRDLGKYVVVDEAFMDFVVERDRYSVIDMVSRYDNLFVLYSLTKFFAVPGLRLGLGLGSSLIIERLNRVRDPWNVNCFAQIAGTESLKDNGYISSSISYMAGEKEYLFREIANVKGFKPYVPSVNYIFINVEGTGLSAGEVCLRLGRQGILVRDCSSYKNLRPVYIRVAVRTREENNRLITALKNLGGPV